MDDTRKMSVTCESDESLTATTNDTSSPTVEDSQNEEENAIQNNTPLKKGPWTAAEDAILLEYVNKNGEGNWNAVQKNTGLARCGKSCRLRWTNHLKPDLKKGAFSPEEETRIIQLHAQMGNKWARMAAELPGRTDNEIKNFWNTRAKKRKREGLDIYPSDLRLKPLNRVNDPTNPLSSIEGNNPPMANEANMFPLAGFKAFDPNTYMLTMSVFPSSASKPQDVRSFYMNKGPPGCLPGSGPISSCPPPLVTQIRNSGYSQIQENLGRSPLYGNNVDLNQGPCLNHVITSPSSVYMVKHALKNGCIACSPEPNAQAIKPELPSLQKQNGTMWDSVLPSPPLPHFESSDLFAPTLPVEDHIVTTRNSGLLDAVIHGSSQSKSNSGSLDSMIHGSLQSNGGLFHGSSLQANDGLLDAVIRGSSRANTGLSGQVLHGSSKAVNNTNSQVDWASNNLIHDPKEFGPESHFPPQITSPPSMEERPMGANLSLEGLDLMDHNNYSGDDLIFPDVSLKGLEMPFDDDDLLLGFDRLFESVPRERASQDPFTNGGI